MKAVPRTGGEEKLERWPGAASNGASLVDAFRGAPQFGEMLEGVIYPVRHGAHGIAMNAEGLIAIVCIGSAKGAPEYDLPGGGVDAGEAESDAMVREFLEETGLPVAAASLVARAGQYWRKDNVTPRNSQFAIFEAFIQGPAGKPSEPHHFLLWMAPEDAISKVRHEAHAWALRRYLAAR